MNHKGKNVFFYLIPILFITVLLLVNCHKGADKKQIVIISIDSLRPDHLSPYGYPRETSPYLAQLIKESTFYTRAYTNGSWTIPSYMSLLTGTLPSRHGMTKDWKSVKNKRYPELNKKIKNIAEIAKLNKPEIITIKFSNLPHELGFARGFDHSYRFDPFFNEKVFNKILKRIGKIKDKDFLVFIHTWMVHAPYTKSLFLKNEKFNKENLNYINNFREIARKRKATNVSNEFVAFLRKNKLFNVKDCIDLYDSGIHYVDHRIKMLMNKFKELAIFDDLLIIFTSDHGEHFNDHIRNNFYGYHGLDLFEEFVRVPLIIKYPHKKKSKRINSLVSLIDVMPTILDYLEIEIPSFVQGESLLNSLSKRGKKYIFSEATWQQDIERKMIRMGNMKYIVTMKNPLKPERVNWEAIIERRLFNLKEDPLEKNNLYKDSRLKNICIELEKQLKKIVANAVDINRPKTATKISKETLEHMKSLGYLD